MNSCTDPRFFTAGVSPFGNLRVDAYFQLTAAYRRLSRPSSALDAKAFTLRSSLLEQFLLLRSLSKTSSLSCLSFANYCWVVVQRPSSYHCFATRRLSSPFTQNCFPLSERPSNLSIKKSLIQLSVSFVCFTLFGFQ